MKKHLECIYDPDPEALQYAWSELNHEIYETWPNAFLNLRYWLSWWNGGHDSRIFGLPCMIVEGSSVAAIIGLTNYRHEYQSVECHFCAKTPHNPIGVKRAVDRYFEYMTSEADLNLIYGHINTDNPRAIRTAQAFGFKPFATIGSLCYSAKEIHRR